MKTNTPSRLQPIGGYASSGRDSQTWGGVTMDAHPLLSDGNRAAVALCERNGFIQFGLEPYAVAVGTDFISKLHMWGKLERNTGPS